MSRIFTITSSPRTGPTTQARRRRACWRAGRGPGRRARRPSSGSLTNAPGVRRLELVRSDEGDPHDQQGEDREHRGEAVRTRPRPGRRGLRRASALAPRAPPLEPCAACRWLHSHATSRPNDSASRASATRRAAWVRASGSTSAAAIASDDPLRRGDDLAPVARRELLAHPRQHPPGCEERVACRADREHPRAGRAGDVHAEHEDQERVDLAVEARAQRRRRPRASHDPSVDRVQRERDDRRASPAARPARAGRTSPRSAPRRRRRAWPG